MIIFYQIMKNLKMMLLFNDHIEKQKMVTDKKLNDFLNDKKNSE